MDPVLVQEFGFAEAPRIAGNSKERPLRSKGGTTQRSAALEFKSNFANNKVPLGDYGT